MNTHPRLIGIALGIIAGIVAFARPFDQTTARRTTLPEASGALSEIVIHYVEADTIALPVYQSFLHQLPASVTVDVVCPDQQAFDELVSRVGRVDCRLVPVVTHHPMTVWSRDRWVATAPSIELLSPRDEDGVEQWPDRAGDARVAFDLASFAGVEARKLPLFFDAGDLLADEDCVFVTPAVVRKNLQRTVISIDQLTSVLDRELGKRIVLLDQAPDHHAGMFMMSAGRGTMLVGDPSLGRLLIDPNTLPEMPSGPDFSAETQRRFDAVASQLVALGHRVVRVPTVVSPDAKTYLSYVNVLTDHRDGRDIVYMPTYHGADRLNAVAADVWRGLGYEVRIVDCTSSYRYFGSLHCLVNVLRRS